MEAASPTDLANAVSAYATVLAGAIGLAFCWLVGSQPMRWRLVYLGVFITGLPTIWMHGFGEPFAGRVADIGTNLLLGWALQVAVLGDYYSARTRRTIAGASALVNAGYVAWMLAVGDRKSVV